MYSYCGPFQRNQSTFDSVKANREMEAYTRTDEITSKHKEVVIKMRSYFDSLEIREE
jgi:hypothetical protein